MAFPSMRALAEAMFTSITPSVKQARVTARLQFSSRERQASMSRYSNMSPGKKRRLIIGTVLFFVVMIGMIAWAYVVAENKIR